MRAFVFDHAELLAMTEKALDSLIRMLTPELINKIGNVIYSEDFKKYNDNDNLKDCVQFLYNKLDRYIKPIMFVNTLKEKNFPGLEESYFDIISNYLFMVQDKEFLYNRKLEELKEICNIFSQFINISVFLPNYYKPGSKEDFNIFYSELKENVIPRALSLYVLENLPFNKNIISEIKNNASILYNKNAKIKSSGFSYICSQTEITKIILEGYKWKIYCLENKIDKIQAEYNCYF